MALKKYILIVTAVILLLTLYSAVAANPGSSDDPVVSLSYINDVFIPQIMAEVDAKTEGKFSGQQEEMLRQIQNVVAEHSFTTSPDNLYKYAGYTGYIKAMNAGLYTYTEAPCSLTVKQGERLVISQGGSFTISSGSARIEGDASAELVNVTAGGLVSINSAASHRARYVLASNSIVSVKAVSDFAATVQGYYQVIPAGAALNIDYAFVLSDLGLFQGTGSGFELEREATRLEALIMFLRLIGEEKQALSYGTSHPFTDVPKWGNGNSDRYVAYAYDKGYTNGTSKTLFSAGAPVTAEQYMTFVLRALGYKDGEDFEWLKSLDKAVSLGILTSYEKRMTARTGFTRDDVVYFSYYALLAGGKSGGTRLIDSLAGKGIITSEMASAALSSARSGRK